MASPLRAGERAATDAPQGGAVLVLQVPLAAPLICAGDCPGPPPDEPVMTRNVTPPLAGDGVLGCRASALVPASRLRYACHVRVGPVRGLAGGHGRWRSGRRDGARGNRRSGAGARAWPARGRGGRTSTSRSRPAPGTPRRSRPGRRRTCPAGAGSPGCGTSDGATIPTPATGRATAKTRAVNPSASTTCRSKTSWASTTPSR